MGRAHARFTFQNPDGSILLPVTVSVIEDATNALISDSLWTTETGSTALGNPFTTATGVAEFFLDTPQRVRLDYTPPGGSPTFVIIDTTPDASTLVTADTALVITGTPDPTKVLIGGADGLSAEWGEPEAAADAPTNVGESSDNPQLTTYLLDPAGNTWELTVDTAGHLITTLFGG